MSFPRPTFLPPDEPGQCEALLWGRLIRADSPALLEEALLEAILGPLPLPGIEYRRAA